MKNICIIPARGGSKRIPKKNIKNFCGKPLISYSITTALNSGLFDKVLVSTDSIEIANVSKRYGAEVHMRPKELADDFTGTWDVIDYVIESLKKEGFEYNYVCTIYATAPFLKEKYLKEGYERLKDSNACRSFSVTTMPFPVQRTFKITKDGRCEMFWPENYHKRSQDLEEAYQDAGQFYWQKVGCKSDDVFFGKDSIPIVLPRYLVQDIDTLEDFKQAELMYQALFPDKYDRWNSLKKELNKKEIIKFYNRNIYFVSVGQNVGSENYGKDEYFLRPVLVYKKLTKTLFIGIPLTSREKDGSHYFKFSYKKNKQSIAMLNQMRVFDIRRAKYLSGKVNKNTYKNLQDRVREFLEITPQNEGNTN